MVSFVGMVFLPNVKEHATPLAGASVETGAEVHVTGDVADSAASGGCVSRLVMRSYSRECDGDRDRMLEMALRDLWRNYPEWPSTFGPCHNPACDGSGRGSGFCARCVVDAIGEIVGDALAASGLHRHIVDARAEARKLRALVSSHN